MAPWKGKSCVDTVLGLVPSSPKLSKDLHPGHILRNRNGCPVGGAEDRAVGEGGTSGLASRQRDPSWPLDPNSLAHPGYTWLDSGYCRVFQGSACAGLGVDLGDLANNLVLVICSIRWTLASW